MYSFNNARPRILLVDDDSSQIVLLHQALKEIGQVIFEQDGESAIRQALETLPDILLLDIEMPGLNGHEVLATLKSNSRTQHIPIIVITVHTSIEAQLTCLEAGAVDFLAKPLQPEVVAARVRTQLTLKARERELTEVYRHARLTLESIGDAVITTDQEGRVRYMNPLAESMTGMPLKDAIGQPIEEVMPLRIGEDGPSPINPARLAIAEQRKVGVAFNYQMLRQDRNWVSIDNSAAPLFSDTGDVTGAVVVFDDINETRAMALKMAHTVQYDQLTNLPNRFLLLERLKVDMIQCQRSGKMLGLLLIDINRFKLINEEFGFEYGDALLKSLAQRIKARVRRADTVSRHHADEFMVVIPEFRALSDFINLAELIREHLMQITQVQPELTNLSVSMGLSVYPDDAIDADSLMLNADAALKRAQNDPNGEGISFYSEDMASHFLSRRQRYSQLKKAITDQKVVVLYQPMVDPDSGQLQAVEALVRIRQEDGSLMSPLDFIPLAEETRLIIPLGECVIEQALDQLRHWTDEGQRIRLCLNVSPAQFADAGFVPFLISRLNKYGIDPKLIELEVTENLMMDRINQVVLDMARLRALGISISIDDFGTGFSCLSYLKDLPVDVLKIDKSFVAQITREHPDDVLVRTIAGLAQSMGLLSVAEGVENAHQASVLRELGVSFLQGFYFSRPVPANELTTRYSV